MERRVIKLTVILASLVTALLAIGWLGFMIFEGISPSESIAHTINILSMVGLGNPPVTSTIGAVIIAFLEVGAVAIVAVTVGTLSQVMILGTFRQYLGRYRMDERIKSLNNHFIIAGYSLTGQSIISDLLVEKQPFVVIENDPDKITRLKEEGLLYLEGDATDENVLKNAGIERCRALFAVLSTDNDNLMVVLSASGLNDKAKIITRMTRDEYQARFLRAGADAAISQQEWASRRMIQAVLRPHLLELLSILLDPSVSTAYLDEVMVPDKSPLINRTLAESNIRPASGIVILGIRRESGELIPSPGPKSIIEKGDVLIGFGQQENFKMLYDALVHGTNPVTT